LHLYPEECLERALQCKHKSIAANASQEITKKSFENFSIVARGSMWPSAVESYATLGCSILSPDSKTVFHLSGQTSESKEAG
jgi:hypothetical protein